MVYFIQEHDNPQGLIKIGRVGSRGVLLRLAALQSSSPVILTVLNVILNESADTPYHKRFANSWAYGEWFNPTPDLLAFIAALPISAYTNKIAHIGNTALNSEMLFAEYVIQTMLEAS